MRKLPVNHTHLNSHFQSICSSCSCMRIHFFHRIALLLSLLTIGRLGQCISFLWKVVTTLCQKRKELNWEKKNDTLFSFFSFFFLHCRLCYLLVGFVPPKQMIVIKTTMKSIESFHIPKKSMWTLTGRTWIPSRDERTSDKKKINAIIAIRFKKFVIRIMHINVNRLSRPSALFLFRSSVQYFFSTMRLLVV